jgi:division protein CdvB (Snf7/Vps24/ESCRT-III family)
LQRHVSGFENGAPFQKARAGRELAEVDHSIREQRSKLQACEARLSKLRQQEAQKEKAAAAGFNKAGKFDDA